MERRFASATPFRFSAPIPSEESCGVAWETPDPARTRHESRFLPQPLGRERVARRCRALATCRKTRHASSFEPTLAPLAWMGKGRAAVPGGLKGRGPVREPRTRKHPRSAAGPRDRSGPRAFWVLLFSIAFLTAIQSRTRRSVHTRTDQTDRHEVTEARRTTPESQIARNCVTSNLVMMEITAPIHASRTKWM